MLLWCKIISAEIGKISLIGVEHSTEDCGGRWMSFYCYVAFMRADAPRHNFPTE